MKMASPFEGASAQKPWGPASRDPSLELGTSGSLGLGLQGGLPGGPASREASLGLASEASDVPLLPDSPAAPPGTWHRHTLYTCRWKPHCARVA